jgi:transcriptional regulator with XRE-family HTH domain
MSDVSVGAQRQLQDSVGIPAAPGASTALARAVEARDVLAVLREDFGLTQQALAEACGVSGRTVRSWEGGTQLRRRHDDRLRLLVALILELSGTLTPEGVRQWLAARNWQLNRCRPLEVLGAGDDGAVFAAARSLIEGDYV